MGATERVAEFMKTMRAREIDEMPGFAEFLLAKRDRDKADASATPDKCAGRHDGVKRRREDLYDLPAFVHTNRPPADMVPHLAQDTHQ